MKRLTFFFLFLLVSSGWASKPYVADVICTLEGPDEPFPPGPVTYNLTITPTGGAGTMHVSLAAYPNLVLLGDPILEFTFEDRAPRTFPIELIVPPNDTCHLSVSLIEIGDCAAMGGRDRYFFATDSEVEVFNVDPRPVRDYEMEALKRQRDSARAVRDSVKAARKIGPPHPWDGWSGPLVTGRDSLGNETWDSIASERLKQGIEPRPQGTPPPPPLSRDSVEKLIKARQQESRDQARLVEEVRRGGQSERGGSAQEQKERFIRNHPIAEAVEFVADGPILWVRREGDSVFTISTPINDLKAYREERAKRNADKRAGKQYDIVLDLSKPEDRAFVDKLHLDLKATDRVGYFRTTVDRSTVMKLEAAKITWTAYPLLPDRTFSPDYEEQE